LHDQGRWDEALAAYRRVDGPRLLEQTNAYQRWRLIKVAEQIAYCLVRLGRHEEARDAFAAFLDEFERADPFDVVPPSEILEVAGELGAPLVARLRAAMHAKGWPEAIDHEAP